MAINKKNEFDEPDLLLADFCKALAHPARVAILRTLAARKSCVCGEIVEVLPLAQATVSQHLKELKNAGLISGEIEGVKSCYCINWPVFERFAALIGVFSQNIQQTKPTKGCC